MDLYPVIQHVHIPWDQILEYLKLFYNFFYGVDYHGGFLIQKLYLENYVIHPNHNNFLISLNTSIRNRAEVRTIYYRFTITRYSIGNNRKEKRSLPATRLSYLVPFTTRCSVCYNGTAPKGCRRKKTLKLFKLWFVDRHTTFTLSFVCDVPSNT